MGRPCNRPLRYNSQLVFLHLLLVYLVLYHLPMPFHFILLYYKVPPEVIESLKSATRPPLIIHRIPKEKDTIHDLESRFLKLVLGSRSVPFNAAINSKKKKNRAYNILDADADFKNCNGWSLSVDRKAFPLLRGSNIGVFYVNLTKVRVS